MSADTRHTWQIPAISGCKDDEAVSSLQHQTSSNLPTAVDYIKTNWELRRVAASFSLFLWVSAQLTCLFTLSPAAHLAQQDPLPPAFKDSHSYLFLMNPTLTFCVSRSARVACVLLCGSKSESKAMRRTYRRMSVCCVCRSRRRRRLSSQEVPCSLFSQNISGLSSPTWSPSENPLNYVSAFLSLSLSLLVLVPLSDSPFLFYLFMETF